MQSRADGGPVRSGSDTCETRKELVECGDVLARSQHMVRIGTEIAGETPRVQRRELK